MCHHSHHANPHRRLPPRMNSKPLLISLVFALTIYFALYAFVKYTLRDKIRHTSHPVDIGVNTFIRAECWRNRGYV
jgi:hypothetical protein